ncbi:LysR substrate-binding domain-containing protein [Pendulispora brunnea]|uniref:LysR substrate-binding domain-containing protein n=1 Tax=Pendulispora brunnea TaxID=2905690 RepID=A0ABZ2K0A0_9BACT
MDHFGAARAFVRAAELHSFSKAAKDLGVKVSTVSRQIADLERDMRIALFNRSTRGLVLTEGGKTFLAHARLALSAMDEARAVTMALNQTPKGLLRVTLPPAFGRRHVLPHLPAFLQRYPEIDVDAVVTDERLNLIEGGIDLAVRIGEQKDSGLMGRRLAPHRVRAYAHRDYLEREGTPAHPDELDKHVCLIRTGLEHSAWRFRGGRRTITLEPNARVRMNDLQGLFELTLAAGGIALLPDWLADAAAEAQGLRRILTAWVAVEGGDDTAIWAVYPPKKTVSSKVRAFVDFYAERISRVVS